MATEPPSGHELPGRKDLWAREAARGKGGACRGGLVSKSAAPPPPSPAVAASSSRQIAIYARKLFRLDWPRALAAFNPAVGSLACSSSGSSITRLKKPMLSNVELATLKFCVKHGIFDLGKPLKDKAGKPLSPGLRNLEDKELSLAALNLPVLGGAGGTRRSSRSVGR